MSPVSIQVNGKSHLVASPPGTPLLHFLRNELELNGPKFGCGLGQCGACTVLVDGHEQRSCQIKVGTAEGRQVRTIEGLAGGAQLHALQQAFLDHGALQCGFCTSGMIVAAAALLQRNADPDGNAIRRALHGNLCRCGCYPRIVTAVQQAARTGKQGGGR